MSSDVSLSSEVSPTPIVRSTSTDVAIVLACAAGLAHAISTPVHLRWWLASGVFFAAMAAAQLGLAAVLFRNRIGSRAVLAGVLSNLTVVGVYVASRLVALPGQPVTTGHHGAFSPLRAFRPAAPEGVGPFDLFALAVELALIVILTAMLPDRWRARTTTSLMWVGLAMCGLAGWVLFARR